MLEGWNTGIMGEEYSTQQSAGLFNFPSRFFPIFHFSTIPLF
jgi:hypothetical protein